MGTKYSANSISGYNATPPADDGTVSEANKVKYSTLKTKLSDPVKALAEAIDTDLQTHFNIGPNSYTSNQTIGASHHNTVNQVSGASVTLTLSDAATLAAGWFTKIVNTDSSNSVTIGRATGADTINGSAANFTLVAGHAVQIEVNAAADGFLLRSLVINPVTTDTTQTITAEKTLQSSDAGAAAGPNLNLDRNSASPAASDVLGAIPFKGRDSGGGTDTYAQLQGEIVDPTAASEDGRLAIRTVIAGSTASRIYVGNGLYTAGGSDQGANTIQGSAGLFDGSNRVGLVKISSGEVSSASSLDITGLTTSFSAYRLYFNNLVPATGGTNLYLRTSTNGGSTFSAAAGNYRYTSLSSIDGTIGDDGSSSATQIVLAANLNDDANTAAFGFIDLISPASPTTRKIFMSQVAFLNEGAPALDALFLTMGQRVANEDVDAIRILMSSGNISTMNWNLYGFIA